MRVSVSRSKNFPRPTSSSNFLSHLASTRETLFFSLPSYSRKVERSSRGHGEKEASLDLIVASTLVSMSCSLHGWIANLKRALFSYSEGFFPSTLGTTVRTASGGGSPEEVGSKDAILSAPRLSSPIIHSLFWRQGVVYVGRPRWKDNRARSEERGGLLISRRSTIIIGNGTRHDRDEEKWGSVPKERKDGFLRSHGNSSRVFLIHIRLDVFLENNVLKKIRVVSWWSKLENLWIICWRLYRRAHAYKKLRKFS